MQIPFARLLAYGWPSLPPAAGFGCSRQEGCFAESLAA